MYDMMWCVRYVLACLERDWKSMKGKKKFAKFARQVGTSDCWKGNSAVKWAQGCSLSPWGRQKTMRVSGWMVQVWHGMPGIWCKVIESISAHQVLTYSQSWQELASFHIMTACIIPSWDCYSRKVIQTELNQCLAAAFANFVQTLSAPTPLERSAVMLNI